MDGSRLFASDGGGQRAVHRLLGAGELLRRPIERGGIEGQDRQDSVSAGARNGYLEGVPINGLASLMTMCELSMQCPSGAKLVAFLEVGKPVLGHEIRRHAKTSLSCELLCCTGPCSGM